MDKTTTTKADSNFNSNKEQPKVTPVVYSTEELLHRSNLIKKISQAQNDREAPHPEFDDMTYSQYYDTNKRADMSYIPPKKNKYDKRIVTGITREKDNTLLSALLSYNFQPDITVYDDTEMVFPELGNHMEDMVLKSRELEDYDNRRPYIYRELISQGDVFVEEIWECVYTPEVENSNGWKPGQKISDAKFDTKVKPRVMERAAVKLHQGKNCYVGNFWCDDHKKQELVFTYELIPREVAKAIYGTWDRWDNVPETIDSTLISPDSGLTYSDWNLTRTDKGMVGVLKIQEKFSNRFMIMLNGVMMLPINFPLSEISPDGECTIKHKVLEGIVGCAYGKGQPSKTKVEQAVHDEFLRLLILREEQAGAPPMGYKGKKVLNSNIYAPGKITPDMKEGALFPILPAQTALGQADFSMYQLIKTSIDDKTINPTFAGEGQQTGSVTATQIMQEKQAQLLKLGLNFDAIKQLEKELIWSRIGNLIMHYSKPVGRKANTDEQTIEDIYTQFSMETTLPSGKSGIKIFRFTDKEFPGVRDIQSENDQLSEHYGKDTSIVYLNGPEFIKLLKYHWVVNIIPTQENSDQIEGQLFVDNFQKAQAIFGPQSLNYEYGKERFAIHIKEDPTRYFLQDNGAGVDQMLAGSAVGQAEAGGVPAKPGAPGMAMTPPKLNPIK